MSRRQLWGVQAAFLKRNYSHGRWTLAKETGDKMFPCNPATRHSCCSRLDSALRMMCSTPFYSFRTPTETTSSSALVSARCYQLPRQRSSHQGQPSRRVFLSSSSTSLRSTQNDDNDGIHQNAIGTGYSRRNINTRRSINTHKSNQDQEVTSFLNHVKESLCERIIPHIQSAQLVSSLSTADDNAKKDSGETIVDPDSRLDTKQSTPAVLLLVAVSGGCDSMGLLHALLDVSDPMIPKTTTTGSLVTSTTTNNNPMRRFPVHENDSSSPKDAMDLVCEVHVAHFDHRQRGLESEKDAQLVQETCRQYDLPCHVYHWDDDNDKSDHHDKGESFAVSMKFSQDKARQWRQSTLGHLLKDLTKRNAENVHSSNQSERDHDDVERAGVILTAHHANDSQETLLLKLLRGVHVQNLSGMETIHWKENSQTFWARPLLDVTKDQIQHYLMQKGYVWREDESNRTNKYLRNRVRNELIPLMEELVGGDTVLQKRLGNLEEQCRELRTDLSGRVQMILKKHVDKTGRFILSDNEKVNLSDLAARQAMYEWASQATNKRQLSYDLWKRVLDQLELHHNNRQWVLSLGDEWSMHRMGDALQVLNATTYAAGKGNGEGYPEIAVPEREMIEWSVVEELTRSHQSETSSLVVRLPSELKIEANKIEDTITFVKVSPCDFQGIQWKITPPWRKGRSPVKLGSFLRGQKVPLHLRDSAPVIVCEMRPAYNISAADSVLVAVRVNDKWVVDAAWDSAVNQGASLNAYALLQLKERRASYL